MYEPTLGSALFGRWFSATSEGLLVLEQDGTIACVNPVFAAWLAAAVDAVAHTPLARWLADPERASSILAGGQLERVVFRRLDGTSLQLSLTSTSMTHDARSLQTLMARSAGSGWARGTRPAELRADPVGAGELVAELCSAQSALEDQNREIAVLAGQLSRFAWRAAVGELVAGIAHHLNNPVGALTSTLRRLEHKVDALADSSAQAELGALVQRCREISRRIETNVSAVVRTHTAATAEVGRQRLELPNEIETALAMFADRLHQVVIVRDYQDHQAVLAPHDALHLVLSTLFDNSLHAMPVPGVLTLTIRERGELVALRVADNGCGVPSAILPHLFEPILTARPGGAGLGLSTAQRLARAWGGGLAYVPSSAGAIFEITIPSRASIDRAHTPRSLTNAALARPEAAPGPKENHS